MENMTMLSISEIEEAILPFRIGRRLAIETIVDGIVGAEGIGNASLLLSRIFCRLKSADSILEKIRRKRISICSPDELPAKIPDILGFRVIVDTISELNAFERLLDDRFEVISRANRIESPDEFGARGIEYSLRLHTSGEVYSFELQLRTFLQHYWASRSFHLFHKKPREAALEYQDVLLALSETLHRAESLAEQFHDDRLSQPTSMKSGNTLPLRSRVHLVVIEPGERFAEHVVMPLTGNDSIDHTAVVVQKLKLYAASPGVAIVECSCWNFSTFMLNEPHVHVPVDRLERLVL